METIFLPLVRHDLTLDEAFAAMKRASRSGIVWQKSEENFVLFTAAAVVWAKTKEGRDRLSQLNTGREIDVPDIEVIAAASPQPYIQLDALAARLSTRKNYGLLAAGAYMGVGNALLYTWEKELALQLEPSPSDCYCSCGRAGKKGEKCHKDGNIISICIDAGD